jgi:hypothetical protein
MDQGHSTRRKGDTYQSNSFPRPGGTAVGVFADPAKVPDSFLRLYIHLDQQIAVAVREAAKIE